MNEKIVEKLKDSKFLEKIIVMSDKSEVKEAFKKEGIEITDEDLKSIRDLIASSVEKISEIPEEKLDEISGGVDDGLVDWLGDKFTDFNFVQDHNVLFSNSDKIVEAALVAALIGGTIGVQKLIKMGKEKGWWTKKYWEDTLENLKNLKITISTK